MVGRRFMRRKEPATYQEILTSLGLKDRTFVEPRRMEDLNKKGKRK
jgi:hypothetical protein